MHSDLTWLWVLTAEPTVYRGETIDLSTRWDEIVASADAFASLHPAPLIMHHDATTTPLGVVRRFKSLTAQEARAKGIPVRSEAPAMYAGCELNPRGRALYEAKELVYTSPGFGIDVKDERADSPIHPCIVYELSFTPDPHQHATQVPVLDMPAIQLSRKEAYMAVQEEVSAVTDDVAVVEDPAAQVTLETILELLGDIDSRLAALEGATKAPEEVVEMEDKDPEAEALKARVEALEEELEEERAEKAVEAAFSRHQITLPRAELKALYKRDKKAYDIALKMAPARVEPQEEARVSFSRQGSTLSFDRSDAAQVDRAVKHLRSRNPGLSYTEALKQLSAGE